MGEENGKFIGSRGASSARRRGKLLAAAVILVLFIIGTVQALSGTRGYVTAEVDEYRLGVDGTYGDPVFIELGDIKDASLVEAFPFGLRIEGEERSNTVSGTYSCEEYGVYTVHAYSNRETCIVVRTDDGVLVFNCGSESSTEKLFDRLTAAMENS